VISPIRILKMPNTALLSCWQVSVDPGFDGSLVCEDEDPAVKIVGLAWQLEVVDDGARGVA
jgi:hypothetical protein